MANKQDAYNKIEKVQETDMEKAIEMEDRIAFYRKALMKELTFDQKMNERFVEEKMKPIYDIIMGM